MRSTGRSTEQKITTLRTSISWIGRYSERYFCSLTQERVEEDRMIENAAYNQYVAQENAEIVREEMFVAQNNYAVNNF